MWLLWREIKIADDSLTFCCINSNLKSLAPLKHILAFLCEHQFVDQDMYIWCSNILNSVIYRDVNGVGKYSSNVKLGWMIRMIMLWQWMRIKIRILGKCTHTETMLMNYIILMTLTNILNLIKLISWINIIFRNVNNSIIGTMG